MGTDCIEVDAAAMNSRLEEIEDCRQRLDGARAELDRLNEQRRIAKKNYDGRLNELLELLGEVEQLRISFKA